MKLKKLVLQNFKALRDFELNLDGQSADIFADNGVGKTSVYDGLCYLLTGTDSLGRADFEMKPLKKSGEPEHNLETIVEGVFDIDGKELTLCRLFKEKWTKKRGSSKQEFSGHTTDFFKNGVPIPKKEFDACIAEIAPQNVFKLLTSPRYFNEGKKGAAPLSMSAETLPMPT